MNNMKNNFINNNIKEEIQLIKNTMLDDSVNKITLENGLDIYICKKPGFEKKIGLFGTKYGSITNDFIDVKTNERVKVPDGIAHFLEHKLFEQEGANALDLFSKEGIFSNAYTSFNQTVYYFETIDKFNKGLEMLIKLVKTPYFTKENVDKEQGIIGQEIAMYENEPEYMSYFNTLKCMYNTHPVRIDIAGTKESISHITKDTLYTCYNTFYHPSNMFIVLIGDIDIKESINLIKENLKLYENNIHKENITKFKELDENNICKKYNIQKMNTYMKQITLGYKLDVVEKNEIVKREIIAEIIYEMFFSKSSKFYEEQYAKGNIDEEVSVSYEGSDEFSHLIISTSSLKDDIINEIKEYIEKLKKEKIDDVIFEKIKRKKIGESITLSESLNYTYRKIIDSIINKSDMYFDVEYITNITKDEIVTFLNKLDDDKFVYSIVE